MRKVNLIDLKKLLRAELRIYDEKKVKFENALYDADIYYDLITNLTLDDLELFESNLISISLLLPIIYGESKAQYLEQEFCKLLYLLDRLSGNDDLINEYEKAFERLRMLVSTIISEHDVLCNKLLLYKKEYIVAKKKAYYYRSILYRLNTKSFVDDRQVAVIKELLADSDFNHEEQIVIMEYLNHHNIRVKYDNPKISYTTIKMLESDFEDFDLGEIDKESKNKLDECANSIFDAIMFENDDVNNFEITFSVVAMMSVEEKDYVFKKTLNKFLNFLRECKNNMVEDQGYEDIELRKMIIQEYNSYYYKYKSLESYCNLRNTESLEDDEKIEANEAVESLPDTAKNKLFFAKRTTKSYAERDIDDIPEEYFNRVKKLLEGFKNDTLPKVNMDSFVSKSLLKGYKKLKDDQIRIIYRKIFDNNYLVLGIILKKAMDANRQYVGVINRDYNYDISTEELYKGALDESETIYTNLIDYLDKNSRKGNR